MTEPESSESEGTSAPMAVAQHYERLIGLPEPWTVERLEENLAEGRIDLHLTHEARSRFACPHCGRACPVRDHAPERSWRYLQALRFKTFLRARVPRVTCPEHGVVTAVIPWAEAGSGWTLDFEWHVVETLQACASVSAAAKLLDISWDLAHRVMKSAVQRGLRVRNLTGLRLLGLDEKSFLRGQSYISVCNDLEGRRVLEVSSGRTAAKACAALEVVPEAQRSGIQAVAMDLSAACALAVDVTFPDARHVIDRFHVSALLCKMVSAVRRGEHARLLRTGDATLTGTAQLWLYSPENMSAEQIRRFEAVANLNLLTSKAWQVKENFSVFWEQPDETSARAWFTQWASHAEGLKLGAVTKVVKTFRRYLEDFLGYFTHRITNALSEGLNSRIQAIKSAARGFRSFENYRIRILFFCGRLHLRHTIAAPA